MSRHRMSSRGDGGGDRTSRTGTPRAREAASGGSRDPAATKPGAWGWRRRVSLAVLVSGAFLAFLVAALSRPGMPYRTDLIEHWSTDNAPHLGMRLRSGGVALERSELPGRVWLHAIDIAELVPTPGDDLRSVDFLFDVRRGGSPIGDRAGRARFLRAELRDVAHPRSLVATDGIRVGTEELVEFRVPGVAGPTGEARQNLPAEPRVPARWRLEVRTADDVSLSLRCLVGPPTMDAPSTNGGTMAIAVPVVGAATTRWAYPHGRVTSWSRAPAMSRAALLAVLWDRGSAAWVFGWIGVAGVVLGLGIACVPVGNPERAGRRAGWSVGLVFGAFSLVFLTVTPPFMGIDETAHTFSYHHWMKDAESTRATWDLGYRTHLARMLARPHQKFTPGDVGNRFWWYIAGPDTMDTHPDERSILAARVWQITRPWIEGQPAGVQIWRLRWISLLAVSVGVGLGAWMMAGAPAGEARVPALGWWLLLVPSLPYFAMNVSNYPFVIALWAVVAACVSRIVNHAVVPVGVTAALGLAFGLAMHASVNAMPMAGLVGCALAGWLFGRENRGPAETPGEPGGWRRSRASGWLGLAAGLLVSHATSSPAYDAQFLRNVAGRLPALAPWGMWSVGIGVLALCGVFAALEAGMAAVGRRTPKSTASRRWPIAGGFAVLVVLGMAANAVMDPPRAPALNEAVPLWDFFPHQNRLLPPSMLPAPSDANPPVGAYVSAVLGGFVRSWGPGAGDPLISRFFWLENGYLDSLAPSWELRLLTTFFGAGLAALLLRFAQASNRARAIRLVAVMAGTLLTVAAFAFAARTGTSTPALHGRYLIGVYLAILGVCFLGWKGAIVNSQESRPLRLALLLVLPPVILQACSLAIVFERYFGG